MKTYKFIIDEPLMGYVTATRYTLKASKRSRLYGEYKKRIRLIANAAGVPQELENDWSVGVYVTVNWKKRQRIDRSNIEKAIEDSCWKRDRRVLFGGYAANENMNEETAEVAITIEKVEGKK